MSTKAADLVINKASQMRLARDCFDVAIAGWAELVASGDFDGADRVATATFQNWQRHRRDHRRWADIYAGR